MKIFTYGVGRRQKRAEEILSRKNSRYDTLVLLPIPTTKDKKTVCGTDIPLRAAFERCAPGVLVVGYSLPEDFCKECFARGARVYDAAEDEDFLVRNADITAEGALGRLLTSFPCALRDMRIGIIGYGRIGRRLSELILSLYGKIVVYTRSHKTRMELGESGIETRLFYEDCDFSGIDILMNTAPTRIVSEEGAERFPRGLTVFELASGDNFPDGIGAVRLASLPEKMYPETAGAIYAEFIERQL